MAKNNLLQSKLQKRQSAIQEQAEPIQENAKRSSAISNGNAPEGRLQRSVSAHNHTRQATDPEFQKQSEKSTARKPSMLSEKLKQRERVNRATQNNTNDVLETQTKDRQEKDFSFHESTEVENDYEEALNVNDLLQTRREQRNEKRQRQWVRTGTIVLIIGCVYLCFLIYGAINTSYIYGTNGAVVAERLSVKELRSAKEFDKVLSLYRQARTVYEKVLLLDYRAGSKTEDPILIGPEYESVNKKDIQALSKEISGTEVLDEYNQVIGMMQHWADAMLGEYCSDMSGALSQNSMAFLELALEKQTQAYERFSLISQNVATLGANISGINVSDILEWSPEAFIREQTEGSLNSNGNMQTSEEETMQ